MKTIESILLDPQYWCPSKKEQYRRQAEAIRKHYLSLLPKECTDGYSYAGAYNRAIQEMRERIEK